jgi:hypothetical protein
MALMALAMTLMLVRVVVPGLAWRQRLSPCRPMRRLWA